MIDKTKQKHHDNITDRTIYEQSSITTPSEHQHNVLPEIVLPKMKNGSEHAFKPFRKLISRINLSRELSKQRNLYKPFLRNIAPELHTVRISLDIHEFNWRLETKTDLSDFRVTLDGAGEWEHITTPHCCMHPEASASYYRAVFELTEEMFLPGTLWLKFGGVDYKAHIFLNGSYIGSHEGYFSPFEFDSTKYARKGQNILLIKVEGVGSKIQSTASDCEKFGIGIYDNIHVEARAPVHISDIFVRPIPEESRAEAWVEIHNCHDREQEATIQLSVYGQNFRKTVLRNRKFKLSQIAPGKYLHRINFDIPEPRCWQPRWPWLYQVQIKLMDSRGNLLDSSLKHFGMRSFHMEEEKAPKGRLYLNGREIRLRGASALCFERQIVLNKDRERLIDDILLAKVCNMNFWRLAQRPVQKVYDCCDRLGLMIQTDLPFYGTLRPNRFSEAVRQAQAMERVVRSHPCSIMVNCFNESLIDIKAKPVENLKKSEIRHFYNSASHAVKAVNPDRVIIPFDEGYNPPCPDHTKHHHLYDWHNVHKPDIGRLHKGIWHKTKPDWMSVCRKFGVEGLDSVKTMQAYYPSSWLPQADEEERTWSPKRIDHAHTIKSHHMWYDAQTSLYGWVRASQKYQAWAIRMMTEAFRRNNKMNSFAAHLFIDVFGHGSMKAIMDADRQPKLAFYAYRDALTPLMANLRTDRYAFTSGSEISIEAWICNDLHEVPVRPRLHYQIEMKGKVLSSGESKAVLEKFSSVFQGFIRFTAPDVELRDKITVRLGLLDANGGVLHDTSIELSIFAQPKEIADQLCYIIGKKSGQAARLCKEMGIRTYFEGPLPRSGLILVDDVQEFLPRRAELIHAVRAGSKAIFLGLPEGKHRIAGDRIEVAACKMSPRHFVSRKTRNPMVCDLLPEDFRFWYDSKRGYITPILSSSFRTTGWKPILICGDSTHDGEWDTTLAAAERSLDRGIIRICQVDLAGRVKDNPVAFIFARRLLGV